MIPILDSGGINYPGFSSLTGKSLRIFHPNNPSLLLYELNDEEFASGYDLGNGTKLTLAVSSLSSSLADGFQMTITSIEEWTAPKLSPGSHVEFRANLPETWDQTAGPGWTLNEGSTGQKLLFRGRIDRMTQTADQSSGSSVLYECRGLSYYANYIFVCTAIPDVTGIQIPERHYNVDGTRNRASWIRSIKKNSSFATGGAYSYAPYGDTGIRPGNSFHASGISRNIVDNLKMTVGEIIMDLFGSHGEQLRGEGLVPIGWDPITNTGTKPYDQTELDALDVIPDEITFSQTRFVDAIRALLRKSYPNYSLWVTNDRIWRFTPLLDNLDVTADDTAHIYNPDYWLGTRLPTVEFRIAEPEPENVLTGRSAGEIIFGRLVRASIEQSTADRYTSVRITGSESTETSEASTQNGMLLQGWGSGDPATQVALQSGYVAGGPASSTHRHWDRGNSSFGIPIYKAVDESGNTALYFKGYQSQLWPHTNTEWNGTTCLLESRGVQTIRQEGYDWTSESMKFTIISSANVADIGDGEPGYKVVVEDGPDPAAIPTVIANNLLSSARIQLSDDFGLRNANGESTTIQPNQLTTTYREFKISEDFRSEGGAYNLSSETPCNARVVVDQGSLFAATPANANTGSPNSLLEFGASLGQTSVNALGRIHMQGESGTFWFGGSLIIPFAAIKQGKEQAEASQAGNQSALCARGTAVVAPEIRVIYEKATQVFREVRVPAEGYSGTAAILSNVRRELKIRAPRFTNERQRANYQKIAAAILRTVSDIEPRGDGWEFIEAPRLLSLLDLHFRMGVDYFRTIALGGYSNFALNQAVVTKIELNFEEDTATVSLNQEFNPLGTYGTDTLEDIIFDKGLQRRIDEEREKEAREAACANSYQKATPVGNDLVSPICSTQVIPPTGPSPGKVKPPVDCHVLGGFPTPAYGVLDSVKSGSGSGVPSYDAPGGLTNLSDGQLPVFHPFLDARGRLFLYDRFGAWFRADEDNLVEGESEHENLFLSGADDRNKTKPEYRFEERGQTIERLLNHLFGATAGTPPSNVYNTVQSYASGVITLNRASLETNEYQYGQAVITVGPSSFPLLYIASNTEDTITLKVPSGGVPADDEIPAGSHIYVVPQMKPYPDGTTIPEDSYIFQDSTGVYFALQPDGTLLTASLDTDTDEDFRPVLNQAVTPFEPVWDFGFDEGIRAEALSKWNVPDNLSTAWGKNSSAFIEDEEVIIGPGSVDRVIGVTRATVPEWYAPVGSTHLSVEVHFFIPATTTKTAKLLISVAKYGVGTSLPLTFYSEDFTLDTSGLAGDTVQIQTFDFTDVNIDLSPGDEISIKLERMADSDVEDDYSGSCYFMRAKIKSGSA